MPPFFPTILFDMDGVLVDSRDAIARSINHALEAHDVAPRPEAELHTLIGAPLPEVFEDLLRAGGGDPGLAPSCLQSYRTRYGPASLRETQVVPGMPEALEILGRDRRMAVATTKPVEFARPILEALGLLGHFETVVGSPLHEKRGEEKTVTIRRALEGLGLAAGHPPKPGTVAMVGDRHYDVRGALANGLRAIGVTWGAGTRAELEAAGAHGIVHTPSALVALANGPVS